MARGPIIGVVGAGSCSEEIARLAFEVGCEIARNGGVVLCGGLKGVMAEVARGAREAGGTTMGILPGPSIHDSNPYIDFPVATGMGQARNAIIVQTSEVLISVAGGYGTLSEIAMALKIGKGVVSLRPQFSIFGTREAKDPGEAVREALALIEGTETPSKVV